MGAYESSDPSSGPLYCSFTAIPNEGFTNLSSVLYVSAGGANTNILKYWWDFQNNGTWDYIGPAGAIITNTFTSGYYTVKLMVSNSAMEIATCAITNVIYVAPAILYVATNGNAIPPYMTWETAANYIQDAIDRASSIPSSRSKIFVGPGTYNINSPLDLAKPVHLIGTYGPSNTIIKSSGSVRCVALSHSNAVIDSFTLTGVNYSDYNNHGGGAYITAGTVTNCIIKNNRIGGRGGGVYLSAGLVTHSQIISNRCTEWQFGYGGGAYISGNSKIQNCIFIGNWTESHRGGGAIYMAGGIVRNCLLYKNKGIRANAGSESDGGGILLAGGLVENCTIAHNTSIIDGGGVKIEGTTSSMTNCIVYYNKANSGNNNIANPVRVGYSCSPDLTHGINGNITNPPIFANTNIANYVILINSPCLNTGTNRSWMATLTDLAGETRIRGNRVDMGCYEYNPPKGSVFMIR